MLGANTSKIHWQQNILHNFHLRSSTLQTIYTKINIISNKNNTDWESINYNKFLVTNLSRSDQRGVVLVKAWSSVLRVGKFSCLVPSLLKWLIVYIIELKQIKVSCVFFFFRDLCHTRAIKLTTKQKNVLESTNRVPVTFPHCVLTTRSPVNHVGSGCIRQLHAMFHKKVCKVCTRATTSCERWKDRVQHCS